MENEISWITMDRGESTKVTRIFRNTQNFRNLANLAKYAFLIWLKNTKKSVKVFEIEQEDINFQTVISKKQNMHHAIKIKARIR